MTYESVKAAAKALNISYALVSYRVRSNSENNKQAYTDGINPGNGLKRVTDSGEIG